MLQNFKKKVTLILKIESVTIYLINLSTKRLFSNLGIMNKIITISAVNKKLLSGFWYALLAVLILLVNWICNIPVNQMTSVKVTMAETEKYMTRIDALHTSFLYDNIKYDNLFTFNRTENENEAQQLFGKITGNLVLIGKTSCLKRKIEVQEALSGLSGTLSELNNNQNDFFLATHELGNKNTGLIKRWQDISNRMNTVTNFPDKEIKNKLDQLKQSESEYLLTRDPRLLNNISLITEEIRSQINPEEGGINISDLDDYLVITGNLMALNKRLGTGEDEGIIANLRNSVAKANYAYANLNNLLNITGSKIAKRWNIFRYITIFILIVAGMYILYTLTILIIFKPLEQITNILNQLARGTLPETIEISDQLPGVDVVNKSFAKLISSLREKVGFTQSLNQGIVNARLIPASEEDMLGHELIQLKKKIAETADNQAINDADNQIRRYMNEGLAKFSEILRSGGNDISGLGDVFIKEMVKYLNSIQGGFFVYDDSQKHDPVLNLVSAFAYDRKKYLQKSVAYGEGLIGTCAREKQFINLTEIPTGYISITSGLGDTLPDNLLLIPVLHENELIGVLEIASLNKFKDYEIEFAQEVARNLGSTLVYTRNNQRTANLLAKSQQQALEMAEQEEEMRQNMEELKATQEESHRREDELKGINDAVGNALSVVEYDLSGIIIYVNEKLCSLLGNNREDIIGKTHQEAFKAALNPDQLFWENIQNNADITYYETISWGKRTIQLKEHFTAVLNRNKDTVKYINFVTDDRTGNS
jgi:PAS domain-containing protein